MSAIVIVEDHELLAHALRLTLLDAECDAVWIAPRAPAALLDAVRSHSPELVLLDLDLGPFGDATPLIASLVESGIKVVVLTGTTDRLRIAAALEQGAHAFRSKTDGFDVLLATVRAARESDLPLDLETRFGLLEQLRRSRIARERALAPFTQLTEREQATLRAMGAGQTVVEISASWLVSEATVRTHVRGVLGKLSVRSQLAAVGAALRSGWLDPTAQESVTPK